MLSRSSKWTLTKASSSVCDAGSVISGAYRSVLRRNTLSDTSGASVHPLIQMHVWDRTSLSVSM